MCFTPFISFLISHSIYQLIINLFSCVLFSPPQWWGGYGGYDYGYPYYPSYPIVEPIVEPVVIPSYVGGYPYGGGNQQNIDIDISTEATASDEEFEGFQSNDASSMLATAPDTEYSQYMTPEDIYQPSSELSESDYLMNLPTQYQMREEL